MSTILYLKQTGMYPLDQQRTRHQYVPLCHQQTKVLAFTFLPSTKNIRDHPISPSTNIDVVEKKTLPATKSYSDGSLARLNNALMAILNLTLLSILTKHSSHGRPPPQQVFEVDDR